MRSPLQILSSSAVVGAWALMVPALQLRYLADQAGVTPPGLSLGLAVASGLVLGCLWLAGLLHWCRERLQADPRSALGTLGPAHVPWALSALVVLLAGPGPDFRVSGWRLAVVGLGLVLSSALLAGFAVRARRGDGPRWPAIGLFLVRTAALFFALDLVARPTFAGNFSFPVAFLWGLVVVGALVGWGGLVAALALPGRSVDWGLRGTLGLAAAVTAGGVLNLTWTVSRFTVLGFLALGLSAWVGYLVARSSGLRAGLRDRFAGLREDPTLLVVALMIAAAAGLQYAGSISGTVDLGASRPAFDLHDDQQAYLVFPRKMLETGSLGPEPFEARRMLSLGGQSFLQTLVLAALPLRNLHLLDGGIAVLLLVGLLVGGLVKRRAGPRLGALVLALALSFPHLEMRANTSALLVGVVLALTVYRLISEGLLEEGRAGPNAALVALATSALCCVKSIFLPLIGLFLALSYLLLLWRSDRRWPVVREAMLTGLMVLALLSPWMVSLFQSSHTFLYPVLGRGFEGAQYYDGFANIRPDLGASPFLTYAQAIAKHWSWAAGLIVLLLLTRDRARRCPALSLGVASLATIALLILVRDPNLTRALMRYSFPLAMCGVLGLALNAVGQARRREDGGRTSALVALAALAALILAQAEPARFMYNQLQANVAVGLTGRGLVGEQRLREYRALEAALPDDAKVLTTLREPFLLETSASGRPLMSLPGMAGLPPGIPVFEEAEATAAYLLDHGIRYLAYGGMADPADLLQLTEEDIRTRYPRSQVRWALLRYHQRYDRVVHELARVRRPLYRDHDKILLDLGAPVLTLVPGDSGGRLRGFHASGWTSGDAGAERLGWPLHGGGGFVAVRTHGWHPFGRDEGRLSVRVAVNGEELESLGRVEDGFLFRIGEQVETVETLRLVSATVAPGDIGALAGSRLLGLDVAMIEVGKDRAMVEHGLTDTLQQLSGEIRPEAVAATSGFHRDSAWTGGDGRLTGFSYRVQDGHRQLHVALTRAHPWGGDPDRLALRVLVNGVELARERVDDRTHVFRLYDGLTEISAVRLISSTFVPAELGINEDTRTLGVPLLSIRTAGSE